MADPFSGENELAPLISAFYTHAYQTVLDFDVSPLSSSNRPTAQIIKCRAQIAIGQSSKVVSTLSSSRDASSKALVALAKSDLSAAQSLAESDPDDSTVQICAGSVLATHGEYATATDLLSKHQGSLEAVALLVQIHLLQHRTDLAVKEVAAAKRWAQDSLLINLAEAWVNLRVGGSEKYQSSYYVFEELASAPGNTSPTAIVNQAVTELHLGRVEEAEVALNQALESENVDVETIANALVLQFVIGKGHSERATELKQMLSQQSKAHSLLADIKEKESLFDTAAAKYSAKVSS